MNPMSPATTAVPADDIPEDPVGSALPGAALDDTQVAQWLREHPDFFDLHADLLAEVRIRHPHRGRAISLVERQVLVLRERNKELQATMADLIRIGKENDAIGMRLQELTQDLLRTRDQAQLPDLLREGLRNGFGVPQVAVRLWGIEGLVAPFGDEVSPGLRRRVDELHQPYCGPNSFPEPAAWLLAAGDEIGSMAMLALRIGNRPPFGLLVLGSPDPARFQAGMGTAFLQRIAEIAGASLSRLLAQ